MRAFLHIHCSFFDVTLFTLHKSRGEFIWKSCNHNIGIQKIAVTKSVATVKKGHKGVRVYARSS